MTPRTRIVILGSGFAGTYAYLEFYKKALNRSDIEVVMVSDKDHFLFVPLLHEVATGNLSTGSITQPILSLPQERLDDFIQAEVESLDFDSKTIGINRVTSSGGVSDTLSYDYLILALGSDTAYYGVPGAEANAYPLKSLNDARRIKNRVIELFEEAERIEDDQKIRNLLRFVIVGGGPTGVELAGELSDFLRCELQHAYPLFSRYASIVIADGAPSLLKQLDPWFGEKARDILVRKGNVSLCLNAPAKEVRPYGIELGDTFLEAGMTIWGAGVVARTLEFKNRGEVSLDERSKRVKVQPTLNLSTYPEVFAAGDQAYVIDKDTEQPYTMRAQFAVRQGVCAARNILSHLDSKPLKEFSWDDQGIILSMGSRGALAEMFGIRMTGPLAWFAYRTAYFFKLYGWRRKLRTGLEWFLNLFTPRDISKI